MRVCNTLLRAFFKQGAQRLAEVCRQMRERHLAWGLPAGFWARGLHHRGQQLCIWEVQALVYHLIR